MQTRAGAAKEARRATRHPEGDEAFKRGLSSVFRQWTALELAVFHRWGGDSSSDHAGALKEEIYDMFCGPERIYKDDISLILEDFLEARLNTILEDGSAEEIGEILCNMWRECAMGNFSSVERVLGSEARRTNVVSSSQGLEDGDEIDSDEEDDETLDTSPSTSFGVSSNSLSISSSSTSRSSTGGSNVGDGGMDVDDSQTIRVESEAPPLVDPDGWETVGKSGRKTRNGKR